MSEQTDALNRMARERGVSIDSLMTAPAPGAASDRTPQPWVPLPRNGEQLISFAARVGAIVGANGVFRRGSVPVTIDSETGRVEEMDAGRFQSYVETQLVTYVERGQNLGGFKLPTTMAIGESRSCLRSDAFRYPLRKLHRVNSVRLPIIRRDGRVELLSKGYDKESGIFTAKDCFDYDDSWTLDQAKLFLADLLAEFPFADARAKAAHITAMLAIFGAGLLPADVKRLNFAYRANRPRAGKGLLAATALIPPCGPVQIQSIPEASEELRKILDTEALNGSPYIFFDEVENKLVNRALNSFLTATVWTGRLMNSQMKFAVSQSSTVFITGNNIELSSDLAGRFLLVDLCVAEADSRERRIQRTFDETYIAKPAVRADILAAMWALVRAWDRAGRPRPASVMPGFETWAALMGGIVENAGFGNPMQSTSEEVDPDFADMRAVVNKLSEGVTSRAEYDFQEVMDVCSELRAFEWHLQGKWVVAGKNEQVFELTSKARSYFGKLFSQAYGATVFSLADGRRVRFGRRGRNRQRRYTIEVIAPAC